MERNKYTASLVGPRLSSVSKKKSGFMQKEKWYGYLFISPMVIGFALFLLAPIIAAFVMSLSEWSLIGERRFIGWDNYVRAFTKDEIFRDVVWNTVYFTVVFVPLNIIVTLGLALLLKEKMRGIGFFRTVIFTPVVTSFVVWSILWKYIFQTENGLINSVLKLLGITGPAWLYTDSLAMPVVILVVLIKSMGINMVIFLAALNDVPKMYYEAAEIDGASRWKIFTNVTLPLISPSIFLVTIVTMIGSFKVFANIYVLTRGGPGTSTYVFVYYIYQLAFETFQFGYATAVAYILFVIIIVLTLLQWNLRRKWVHHEQ